MAHNPTCREGGKMIYFSTYLFIISEMRTDAAAALQQSNYIFSFLLRQYKNSLLGATATENLKPGEL